MAQQKYNIRLPGSKKNDNSDLNNNIVLENEELRMLFKGSNLTKEQISALNDMSNTFKGFKDVIGAIRTLKENDYINNTRNAGRKKKELPVPVEVVKMRHEVGDRYEDIARFYNMSRSTLYKLIKEDSKNVRSE